jgi:hypothetical protein
MGMVAEATALEARVAKANKTLKARLRDLQQVFTVRCVVFFYLDWQRAAGVVKGLHARCGCTRGDVINGALPLPCMPPPRPSSENGAARHPRRAGLGRGRTVDGDHYARPVRPARVGCRGAGLARQPIRQGRCGTVVPFLGWRNRRQGPCVRALPLSC